MRYLTWVTAGFLGACMGSAYILGAVPFLGAAAFFACLGLGILSASQKKSPIPALLCGGAMVGFLWFAAYEFLFLKPIEPYDRKTVSASLTLTESTVPRKYGSTADGVISLAGRHYRVRVYFSDPQDLASGDQVKGDFTLRAASFQENSGRFLGDGVFLSAFQKGKITVCKDGHSPLIAWPGRVKAWSQGVINWCFPGNTAAFAKALLLGDTSELSFRTVWDLRISGISHLVAVSGLHISILFMLLEVVTFRNKWLTFALGVPVLLFFGAMTGFTPSVTRACIMMFFWLLARLAERRYDPLTELSAAVCMMLILNPFTVTSVSFQLSVASVLGIFCCFRTVKGRLLMCFRRRTGFREQLRQWFAGSVGLSLSSLTFVTPLTAFYFGSVSLIAPLTNLLIVWLIPLVFWGILLVLAVSLISIGGAAFLGKLLGGVISCILGVSHFLSQVPLAAVFTESPFILLWILITYFWGFYLLRGISKEWQYFLQFSAGTLGICLLLSWLTPLIPTVTMKVYDVGQGQCILLQSEGRNFLVDCGGDREESVALQVLSTLESQGIRKLDGLILTHFDYDHIGAADELDSVLKIKEIYLPKGSEKLPEDGRIRQVEGETELSFGDARLVIYGSEARSVSNEMGLCVLLDSPKYDILITGDRSSRGERMLLENHSIPSVDCLIAGHHGAADSTCRELLNAASPETVIISAGRKNRYNHPAGDTLRRLHNYGCQVLRTDLMGTITIRR